MYPLQPTWWVQGQCKKFPRPEYKAITVMLRYIIQFFFFFELMVYVSFWCVSMNNHCQSEKKQPMHVRPPQSWDWDNSSVVILVPHWVWGFNQITFYFVMKQMCLPLVYFLFQDTTAELYHNCVCTVQEIPSFTDLNEFMPWSEDEKGDTSMLPPYVSLVVSAPSWAGCDSSSIFPLTRFCGLS